MICELCGKNVHRTREMSVEGTMLMVCNDCSKFGVEPGASAKKKKGQPIPATIRERLEARQKRMTERDIYAGDVLDLAADYSGLIRNARKKRGMSQEDLGRAVAEKVSVIKKIENGQMRPNEGLVKKLERALGIDLMEKAGDIPVEHKTTKAKALTLGDLIKRE